MFKVCFPQHTRFKQLIERQQLAGVLIFRCSKTEITIVSMNPAKRCVIVTSLYASCFREYICPDSLVTFAVNSFELSAAMNKSKENQNNCILMTLENVDRPRELTLDFVKFGSTGVEEKGVQTIPRTVVPILAKYSKYSIGEIPDLAGASILMTNSKELNRIFCSLTTVGYDVVLTMTKKKLLIATVPTEVGQGEYEVIHNLGIEEYGDYKEDDIFTQCPKHIADLNTIRMHPDHEEIQQRYSLETLAFCDPPTTHSNRVLMAITPGLPLAFHSKITNSGMQRYFIGDLFPTLSAPAPALALSAPITAGEESKESKDSRESGDSKDSIDF